MTEKRRGEFERVGDLFEGLADPSPEAREAARAALVARFEAAERGAQPVRRGRPRIPGTARIAQAFKRRGVPYAFAAGACAAALVAATIIVAGSSGPTGAYAVEPQPSGLVFVSIHRFDDGKGLQESLREAGVPAVVEFNDKPRRPFLLGRTDLPPGFRNIVPSHDELSNGACTARLPAPVKVPGSDRTIETTSLGYPESLGHLAALDPGLRPILRTSFETIKEDNLRKLKQTLSPKGYRRIIEAFRRIEESRQYSPPSASAEAARAEKLEVPPFTFVPTEYLIPPTDEDGVIFIIDPNGLEAGEKLHLVTTGGGLKSITAYTGSAICSASAGIK